MVSNEKYDRMTKEASPNSKCLKNMMFAFLIGGGICTLGQALLWLYTQAAGLSDDTAAILTSSTLIFAAALLTGLGKFDDLAKYAGAGTLVPITGFANSMAAPALEFKREGMVLGVGAKMFLIAGPVIVYGIVASAVYGIILCFLGV